MSIWTHVAGIIRVDWLPIKITFDEAMKTVKKIVETDVPAGTEGPIKFYYQKVISGYTVLLTNVVIYGDLRSFDDIDKIESWFRRVVSELDNEFMIRQAVLDVYTESSARYIFYYDNKTVRKIKGKYIR